MSPIWSVALFTLIIGQLTNGHCLECKVDLCLVVDQSMYNRPVIRSVKTIIKTLLYMMDIGPNATQVGLIQFARLVHEEFDLNEYSDVTDILSAVSARSSDFGAVRTDCFGAGHGERAGVRKLAIMLTEGRFRGDDVAAAAEDVRNNNITMLVVGVNKPNVSMINVIANNVAANTFLVGTTLVGTPYTYTTVVTAIFDRFKYLCTQVMGVDCSDVPGGSGRLLINMATPGQPLAYHEVICDNGWMVLLRRQDGSVNFNRLWADYKNGFGQLDGELWAGLELMHHVTYQGRNYKLRIDFETYDGRQYYAKYASFKIGSEGNYYRIHVGAYDASSTLSDNYGLLVYNDMYFSTMDKDHDSSSSNCAQTYSTGWWFRKCTNILLTGLYGQYPAVPAWRGIMWYYPLGSKTFAKHASMMIRNV